MAFAPPLNLRPLTPVSAFCGTAVTVVRTSRNTIPPANRRRSVISVPCAQLVGMPEGFGKGDQIESNEQEILLAELRFSDPDKLPGLIENSLDLLDDDFYAFIETKIKESTDIEERDTLRSLRDAITDVMTQILDAAAKAEKESATDSQASDSSATPSSSSDVAEATYDELIDTFLNARTNASPDKDPEGASAALKVSVEMNYHRIDMRMLERLTSRISAGDDQIEGLTAIRDTISVAMNQRVGSATESLKEVLSSGDMAAMRLKIDAFARKGKIDDAFILLLQANIEQAKNAGVQQAVDALTAVLDHAASTKETLLDPEIRLIRRLLRTEDAEARANMLIESLQSRGSVTLMDGSSTSGVAVDGKKFVIALRGLIEDFGNVDEKFVLKLSKIGEESEAVARKLYDMEDKDIQDFQNEAFHKRTVSIWDLEQVETHEVMEGREAPWEGRLGPIPEKMGFGEDGKMQV